MKLFFNVHVFFVRIFVNVQFWFTQVQFRTAHDPVAEMQPQQEDELWGEVTACKLY